MSATPETTKGHDLCRSPLVWMDWNLSATHAARRTAASMAGGVV